MVHGSITSHSDLPGYVVDMDVACAKKMLLESNKISILIDQHDCNVKSTGKSELAHS